MNKWEKILPPNSTAAADLPAVSRSRVTNQSALFLEGVDGRTAIARRWRDLYAEIIADLGGADALSEVERQLARRCATLSVEAEAMEAATAGGGGELDVDRYVVITNALGRAAARIGLRRRMKDATPDLRSYLTERAQAL